MTEDETAGMAESLSSSPVSRKSGKRLNVVIQSAFSGDVAKLQDCFSNEDNPYHDRVEEQINSVDEDGRSPLEIAATEGHLEMLKYLIEKGSEVNTRNPQNGKSPLDMACILGRDDIVKELLVNEVELNSSPPKGYTALHHASVWDHRKCIQLLVEVEADLDVKTSNGERARDIAQRYNHIKCAEFLDLSEAKRNLKNLIKETKEILEDPQKLQGRLAKDEKMTALNACTEKQDWLDNTSNPSIGDVQKQLKDLSEALEPIQVKLSEPPPEKPPRK